MADPVSMGAMIALQAAGTVMSAADEASALRRSARVDKENARRTELQGEIDALQTIRDERAASGMAISAMASSGFAVGTGSAADLIRQNALERETEILNIRYQANQEATGLRQQAADKKRAARSAMIGGIMKATVQVLQGANGMNTQASVDKQAVLERESRIAPRRTSTGLPAPSRYNSFIGPRD
ncbi:MAG: hypothetical protein WBL20_07735 [Sphingobium sp.]|uniref:hypothetical protein n=1 Tax=Sphingobium sp. TaxID=1912891 RepID=UPI003BAF84EF